MSVKEHVSKLDAESFSDLHNRYRERITSSLMGFVRDRNRAEDLTATAFHNAWKRRETFRGDSSPYTWLRTIAFNEARKTWRAEPVLDSIDLTDPREFAGAGLVTDALERQESIERLTNAIGRIPTKYRQVLLSHFVDGYSVKEIARREAIPVGTVLSRIFTGKRLLRKAWKEVT